MFDIGWSELLVIAVVAIIVVGPKDLPRMLRNVGQTIGKFKRMAGEYQSQFNEALKEAELDDLKSEVESLRSLNPVAAIKKEVGSLNDIGGDLKKSIETPVETPDKSEPAAAPAKADAKPAKSRPAKPKSGKSQTAAS